MDLVITIDGGPHERMELYGPADSNLRAIRDALGVKFVARDGKLTLIGVSDAVSKAAAVVELLQRRLKDRGQLTKDDVGDALAELATGEERASGDLIEVYRRSVQVRPRSPGQKEYVENIIQNDLCICLGPAGTGKTYLAVAVALSLMKTGRMKRIILARPAVEAGEKLGYLPGDLQAKVNPYLRPLFDAMHDMMEFEQIKRMMVNDVIEVVPLAFMRGRTMNQSVVILDEAQNATPQQMLMFLTRLGNDSKMIVTGDDSQSDLDGGRASGLVDAVRRLEGIEGIAVTRLLPEDIVRHRLVSEIVAAYGPAAQGRTA